MKPLPPSENTGTTGTTKSQQDRIDKIIALANATKDILEDPNMPEVANPSDRNLILHGLRSLACENFHPDVLEAFSRLIRPVVANESTSIWVNLANRNIEELAKLFRRYLQVENAIPPPSSYAKHTVWVEWQEKANAILCFRPSGKQGLPLCVLDDVFGEFQHQATAPLPPTADAAQAMNAALNLCHTMPNYFAKEADRSDAFDKCLEPLFRLDLWHKEFPIRAKSEYRGGQVDRMYRQQGLVCILREDKVEAGTSDDPYMQVSRDYQLYVESVRDESPARVAQGVPLFLLSLLGPILLICGGFRDANSTIVEPLAEPCLMFDDLSHERQETLARQLFALKNAVDALGDRIHLDGGTVQNHPAGVPRVYTTYKTEDNREQSLTLLRPLTESLPRSLLFVAAEGPLVPSAEKLVKLVRKYGDGVHRLLAKSQFAPALYGQKSLVGAPTAYIMEFLSPHTPGKSGWVTLWEFFKSKDLATRFSKAIENTLGRILIVMEEANVVHGDLRPNNIMLEVDGHGTPVSLGEEQGVNLRVVDFDWAGGSGSVCYPWQRNQEIRWPGAPGQPIVVEHDRALVEGWWYKQYSLGFQA